MSIQFEFFMKPKRRLFGKGKLNRPQLEGLVKALSKEFSYTYEIKGPYIFCKFCVEGYFWLNIKEDTISGNCQTNVAGPGFHAVAIQFLEELARYSKLNLEIEDDTDYFEDRDFQKMRQEHFYQWFTGLMELILEKEEDGDLVSQCICWPLHYYLPEEKKGQIMTHIRSYSIYEIRGIVNSRMSMAFAKDFFIWNEVEKDAYFYRNSALVRMNKECFYMPSDRSIDDDEINQEILELLEKSLELDRSIPFPVKEYLELSKLANHEPLNTDNLTELFQTGGIGCRKGMILRDIGCIRFPLPGNYLYEKGENGETDLYFDGLKENWHNYRITAFTVEGEAKFHKETFEDEDIEEILSFKVANGKCKLAVYKPVCEEKTSYYMISAQLIYMSQNTIITICYENPSEKKWAINLIKKIQTIGEERME